MLEQARNKSGSKIKKLVLMGVNLALCLLLPFLTGQIPQIGSMLSPMHIPVLLCGFMCGWQYGMALGFVAPLLRSLLFGMPPLVPVALVMAFEMAVYGLAAGLLYRLLPKKTGNIYLSLVLAMLIGRIAWGITATVVYGILGLPFTFSIFLMSAFVNAIPGIIAHILLIPPIVIIAKKSGLME